MDDGEIKKIVLASIEALNLQLPKEERITAEMGTHLAGGPSPLDSLSIVNLVVNIEEAIEARHGVYISLISEDFSAENGNPFETVSSLIQHISGLLRRRLHA